MEYMDKELDIIISEALKQVDEIELPDGFHNKLLSKIDSENKKIVSRETIFEESSAIVSRETKKSSIFAFKKYALLAAAIAIMIISIKYINPVDMMVANSPMQANIDATKQNEENEMLNNDTEKSISQFSVVQNEMLLDDSNTPAPANEVSGARLGASRNISIEVEQPHINNPVFAIGLFIILIIFVKIIQVKSKK